MLDRLRGFFRDELWDFRLCDEHGVRHFLFKWLRIIYLALRGFVQNKCSLSASSLTYYTLMSIVPVLAMAFAIARGFGYHEVLREQLLNRFQDQNGALVELFKYADSFLEQARGGVIAGVGLVILFLTVVLLLSNLEGILNHIWGVKKLRSWRRIFSDYFALMLIAPIFFILASSMTVFVVDYIEIGIRALPLSQWMISWLLFFVNLIPYGLFWVLFTFIYAFMPNTKVQFRSASLGGIFAGCLYVLGQWAYIYFQIGVTRYGAIYGSMAALPLFLVWVQVSWFLLLLGAEMSYAHQTLDDHEFEGKGERISQSYRRLITIWIVHLALKKGVLTKEILVKSYQIPACILRPILQELVDCGIFHEARGGYVPSHIAFEMRISDLLHLLDLSGENDFPFIDAKALFPFEKALNQFRKQIETTPENIKLNHVPHTI